jgi:hypothetical protein
MVLVFSVTCPGLNILLQVIKIYFMLKTFLFDEIITGEFQTVGPVTLFYMKHSHKPYLYDIENLTL